MTDAAAGASAGRFVKAFIMVSLFVHASEIARYFFVVMPEMREDLAALPGVAPMSPAIFASWGVWTSLLVAGLIGAYWLAAARFGDGVRTALIAGGAVWVVFFVLFWLGMINMGLASAGLAAVALPWALAECAIACAIARACLARG